MTIGMAIIISISIICVTILIHKFMEMITAHYVNEKVMTVEELLDKTEVNLYEAQKLVEKLEVLNFRH